MTCGAADLTEPVTVETSTVCVILSSVHKHQHGAGFTSKVWSVIYDVLWHYSCYNAGMQVCWCICDDNISTTGIKYSLEYWQHTQRLWQTLSACDEFTWMRWTWLLIAIQDPSPSSFTIC